MAARSQRAGRPGACALSPPRPRPAKGWTWRSDIAFFATSKHAQMAAGIKAHPDFAEKYQNNPDPHNRELAFEKDASGHYAFSQEG